MPPRRITLHRLEPDTSPCPLPQFDALIAGTGISPPSTIVLDYMYGVAAYRRWGSGHHIMAVMEHCFTEHYRSIPIPPASPPSSDDDSSYDLDDNDEEHKHHRRPRRRNHHSHTSDGMLRAMDDILGLSMLLKGTTPELIAVERQRREEAEESRAKEASRVKVQRWMQGSTLNSDIESNASHTTRSR